MLRRLGAERISLGLLGGMLLLPFLEPRHYTPVTSFHSEWLAVAFGLAAMIPLALKRAWQEVRYPAIIVLPAILMALLGIQAAILGVGDYPERLITAAAYLLWALCLMVVAATVCARLGWQTLAAALSWFLLLGGMLSAFIALIQYYSVPTPFDEWIARKWAHLAVGNIGQANHFADYLALALASLLHLICGGNLGRAAGALAGAVLLFALGVCGSRSSWLYLAAFCVVASVLYLRDKQSSHRSLLLASLALLPAFALVQYLAGLIAPPGAALTATERLFQDSATIPIRLDLWRLAWGLFAESPLLGIGFGQFAWRQFLAGDAYPNLIGTGVYDNAHNLFMHLLAEQGVLAVGLVTIALAWWARGLFAAKLGPPQWWLLALLSVLGIHSMLEYPLWYANFLGIASVLLGAGDGHELRFRMPRYGRALFILMLLLGAWSIFDWQRNYANLEQIARARFSLAAGNLALEDAELQRIGRESLLSRYVDYVYCSMMAIDHSALPAKLALSESSMRFVPNRRLVYRHAYLLALHGDAQLALQQLDRAMALYPPEASDVAVLKGFAAQDPQAMLSLLSAMQARIANGKRLP